MLIQYTVFDVKFVVLVNCLMKVFGFIFLHDALHIWIRQGNQKLMLHKILDVYSRINFTNSGLSIVQKVLVYILDLFIYCSNIYTIYCV